MSGSGRGGSPAERRVAAIDCLLHDGGLADEVRRRLAARAQAAERPSAQAAAPRPAPRAGGADTAGDRAACQESRLRV